jgi:hypothetical protein
MIDIDKYEGHTLEYGMHCARLLEHLDTEPNRRLIADALPLLEEVKRLFEEVKGLREGIEQALEAMSCHTNHPIYNSSWNILKELIEC